LIAYATDSHCDYIASLLFRCVYASSVITQLQDIRSAQPEEETSTSEDDADGVFSDSYEHSITAEASASCWQVIELNHEPMTHCEYSTGSHRIPAENRACHQDSCLVSPGDDNLTQQYTDLLQEMEGQTTAGFWVPEH
jgi:hypothetical protein